MTPEQHRSLMLIKLPVPLGWLKQEPKSFDARDASPASIFFWPLMISEKYPCEAGLFANSPQDLRLGLGMFG